MTRSQTGLHPQAFAVSPPGPIFAKGWEASFPNHQNGTRRGEGYQETNSPALHQDPSARAQKWSRHYQHFADRVRWDRSRQDIAIRRDHPTGQRCVVGIRRQPSLSEVWSRLLEMTNDGCANRKSEGDRSQAGRSEGHLQLPIPLRCSRLRCSRLSGCRRLWWGNRHNVRQQAQTVCAVRPLHWNHETVADPRQCFDKPGSLS